MHGLCEETLSVKRCNVSYSVFATTERLRCSECGDIGHKRVNCSHGAVQLGSSGRELRNSARLQQEQPQCRDSQRENTTELDPGGNDSQSTGTPEPELKEVSDEHGSTVTNTASTARAYTHTNTVYTAKASELAPLTSTARGNPAAQCSAVQRASH